MTEAEEKQLWADMVLVRDYLRTTIDRQFDALRFSLAELVNRKKLEENSDE